MVSGSPTVCILKLFSWHLAVEGVRGGGAFTVEPLQRPTLLTSHNWSFRPTTLYIFPSSSSVGVRAVHSAIVSVCYVSLLITRVSTDFRLHTEASFKRIQFQSGSSSYKMVKLYLFVMQMPCCRHTQKHSDINNKLAKNTDPFFSPVDFFFRN